MNLPSRSPAAPTGAGLPRLQPPASAPAGWLDGLRRFHQGELPGDLSEDVRAGRLVPALLHPYRDVAHVRTAYPLVLRAGGGAPVQPLAEAMTELVASFAPAADDSRLLKDNLDRLELAVHAVTAAGAAAAGPALAQAGEQLVAGLALKEAPAAKLRQELYCLVDAVPEGAELVALGPDTALRLLLHAADEVLRARRAEQVARLAELQVQIRQRLDVERAHAPSRRTAEAVAGSVGGLADALFDPAALAGVVDRRRGTVALSPARQARLEEALSALEAFDLEQVPLVTVVHAAALAPAPVPGVALVAAEDPLAAAVERYAEHAGALVDAMRAERVARLELADAYDPAHHEAVLARLDWRSMTRDELLLVPTVVALDRAADVASRRLGALVELLSSGRPVQVLLQVEPALDPIADADRGLGGARLDLAALALGLREPVVHQASVTRPMAMIDGFEAALSSPRPALHLVIAEPRDGGGARLGPWFHAESAIESRAHPLALLRPELGRGAPGRLDAGGNPAADRDWSIGALACLGADGAEQRLELPFTLADHALLVPALAEHFHAVPAGADTGDLLPLAQWLELDPDAALRRVPWIHAVRDDDAVIQVALSRRLAYACRDRLDAWRALQEQAGLKSAHVDRAVAATRAELEAAHAAALDALTRAHAAALEATREAEAAEALGRLAAALVEPDPAFLAGAFAAAPVGAAAPPARPVPAAPPAAAPPAAAPPAAAQPAAAQPEEDELVLGDPWIDSMLCSSCNDCIQINPVLFKYNDQKQATIADASKGTFEELVRAAEKCPSRCIHPGKPQHPNEANLDALVQRAAPFQ